MLGRVFAIIGLLAMNGFFVAAEFSVVRSRRSRLEAMARAGDGKARIVLRATAASLMDRVFKPREPDPLPARALPIPLLPAGPRDKQ